LPTKNTNITFYYLLPQSTQKGEQKSPTKGLRFDEFSRQELAPLKVLFYSSNQLDINSLPNR
ncbi:hypothetical protein, partial [Streptococcus sp.]|uniref:hypothetical protein n=1 Tax=Streptococcus sp. TaxID=1306 RepID=UPI0025EFDC1F